jgi:hypothetical protein
MKETYPEGVFPIIEQLMKDCLTGDIEVTSDKLRQLAGYGVNVTDLMQYGEETGLLKNYDQYDDRAGDSLQ